MEYPEGSSGEATKNTKEYEIVNPILLRDTSCPLWFSFGCSRCSVMNSVQTRVSDSEIFGENHSLAGRTKIGNSYT
jgi:hypothetical protein